MSGSGNGDVPHLSLLHAMAVLQKTPCISVWNVTCMASAEAVTLKITCFSAAINENNRHVYEVY